MKVNISIGLVHSMSGLCQGEAYDAVLEEVMAEEENHLERELIAILAIGVPNGHDLVIQEQNEKVSLSDSGDSLYYSFNTWEVILCTSQKYNPQLR